jgi:hypothetical protein
MDTLDGANQTRLTFDDAVDARPTWSPDGSRIAFNSDFGGDYDLWVTDIEGEEFTQLTTNTAEDSWPNWGYVLQEEPGDFPIEEQLGECLEFTNIVWGRDNIAGEWLAFQPGAPDFLQTLPELEAGGGYLINVSDSCTIEDGLLGFNFIPLAPGWNLFGWQEFDF